MSTEQPTIPAAGGAATALVGRERELGALVEALDEAVAGRGGSLLIGGEPGIGKSRLVDELATRAHDGGVGVLWGKCWEAGGAPAYWPWVQALRSYIRGIDTGRLHDEMGPGAVDIAQMLPEIEAMFPDLRAPASVDPESARFRLFDSATTFLRNAAAADPLLVIIEDLQAADTASLLLLRFVAAQIEGMPLLLVATYRDVELTPDHPLTASITDITREPRTRHLILPGLDEPDVARLAERVSGVVPSKSLVTALHRQTNGNPLFVTEAIRLLTAEGDITTAEATTLRLAIPDAVREVILRRLGHLSPPCRTVLSLASILGQEIPVEALRGMSGLTIEGLTDAVDEASGAGLLVAVAGAIGRFRFSHDLVRAALYDEIPPGQRARLHLTAGDALAEVHRADPEPHLAAIAHHYLEGATVGDAAKAVEYARRGADHAARQLAYEDAVRLYRMALQATELQDSVDPAVQCDLLLGLGDAQMRAGDAPAARETFLGAAGIARRLGLAASLARAALGYGGRFVWARAANDRHLIPLLEDALAAIADETTVLRAMLLARLAGALRDQLDPGPRDGVSRDAVDLARRIGDPATLAYALDGRYAAIWAPDTVDERLTIAEEIIRIAGDIGDTERAFQGHHYRVAALLERGEIHAVHEEFPVNARLATDLRQPAQQWYASSIAAVVALLEGRFDDAEELIAEAFDHGRRAEGLHATGVWLLQSYGLRREQGRAAEVEQRLRGSLDEYAFWPWIRCILLHLYTELGRNAEARGLFEAVAAKDFHDLPWDNDWLMGMPLLAEVTVRLRDVDRAATLYGLIEPYADRNGFGHPEFSTGSLFRTLGLLAGLLGRLEDAEAHFVDAISMNEAMGARPWVAHSRYDLARLLLSRDGPDDRERAAELLAEARAAAEGMGMIALLERIERVSTQAPTPQRTSAGGSSRNVFCREGEYWSIAFADHAIRLRDIKGLRYLAALLASPGREFHALDLVALERGAAPTGADAAAPESGLSTDGWDDAGEILDPQAKAAYRARLTDLEDEIAQAKQWNDPERADRARAEIDALTAALAEAVGLGGRDRRAASRAERARLNVTRAIRTAIARINDHHPTLGTHLDTTIRTGLYCSYTPDPRVPTTWTH